MERSTLGHGRDSGLGAAYKPRKRCYFFFPFYFAEFSSQMGIEFYQMFFIISIEVIIQLSPYPVNMVIYTD